MRRKAGLTLSRPIPRLFAYLIIDLVVDFPRSRRGNIHWLTMVDAFSKDLELVPLKNKTAEGIAKAILEFWVCRRGCPIALLSDNAKEFTGSIAEALSKLLHLDKKTITAYQHTSAGLVERIHNYAHSIQRSGNMKNLSEWDLDLPYIQYTILDMNRSEGDERQMPLGFNLPSINVEDSHTTSDTIESPHKSENLSPKVVVEDNDLADSDIYHPDSERREIPLPDNNPVEGDPIQSTKVVEGDSKSNKRYQIVFDTVSGTYYAAQIEYDTDSEQELATLFVAAKKGQYHQIWYDPSDAEKVKAQRSCPKGYKPWVIPLDSTWEKIGQTETSLKRLNRKIVTKQSLLTH